MNGKKKFKKFLVLNITLVFVTVSMMNNVVGFVNNENGININYSNKDIENDLSTGDNYAIINAGYASVDYVSPNKIDVVLECGPDYEKNISIKGPDLNLIFLLRTNISLRFEPIIRSNRQARYEVIIEIDDAIRYDSSYMRIIDPGFKSNILAIGYLLKNAVNRTVKLTIEIKVMSQNPKSEPKYCTCTIILNINGTQQGNQNNCDNYVIIHGGNGSVDYVGPGKANLNLLCEPDVEYNISICGPNLILIFLLGTNVSLRFIPIIPLARVAGYSMYIEIDGVPRSDTSRMKIVEPGSKSNILGVGYLLKNACDQTVKITLQSSVYSIFPFRFIFPKICERTVILHVNCEQ